MAISQFYGIGVKSYILSCNLKSPLSQNTPNYSTTLYRPTNWNISMLMLLWQVTAHIFQKCAGQISRYNDKICISWVMFVQYGGVESTMKHIIWSTPDSLINSLLKLTSSAGSPLVTEKARNEINLVVQHVVIVNDHQCDKIVSPWYHT